MLKEEELKNQKTFLKYDNHTYYDELFDFQIKFEINFAIFSLHNEVDGSTRFLKYINDLDDLKNVYEAITDKNFI
jgi:hypothetical protein